jgi:hypothetical protein
MTIKKSPPLIALAQALGVIVYCLLIGLLLTSFEEIGFEPSPYIGPAAMLVLFVFSAAATSLLVFGYPAYLFVNRDFRKGLTVVGLTLSYLVAGVALLLLAAMLF